MEHAGVPAYPDADVVFRDGLGERRLILDPSTAVRELLCIRTALSEVPVFDFALRDRIRRLGSFEHPYFVPARSVERLTDRRRSLALVSDRFNGIRLAQLFPRLVERGVRLDIDTAMYWLRQLLEALARFHESSRDIAHGALGPDRVLLTSNGRLRVTEYALGGALALLGYSPERYWRELRIPVLRSHAHRLDQRTDVAQVGVLALSLILGRELRDDEYHKRVGDLLAAAWAAVPAGGFEPVPPRLRQWLAQALQLDPSRSFAAADEASRELERVCETIEFPGSSGNVDRFVERYRSHESAGAATTRALGVAEPDLPSPREASAPDVGVRSYADEGPSAPILDLVPQESETSAAGASTSTAEAAATRTAAQQGDGGAPEGAEAACLTDFQSELTGDAPQLGDFQSENGSSDEPAAVARSAAAAPDTPPHAELPPSELPVPRAFTVLPPTPEFEESTALPPAEIPRASSTSVPALARRRVLAGVAVGIAIVAGLTPSLLREPDTRSTGTLMITTVPQGAAATIDGRPAGTTPVTVSPGYHTVELQHGRVSRVVSVTVQAGARFEQRVEFPVEPKEPVATGWVTVRADIDFDVYEGTTFIGSTAGGRLALPVGTHILTFRHDGLGFRSTRSVDVAEGASTTATEDLPNGLVRVLAQPWAEVWIDGKAVGRTLVGNLPIPIGTHDVVLRHRVLGEQRHKMTVLAN